ncbi:TIGR01212 family radical SAM protein [Anaerovorax odorimutans]|uniref:TIGR01212 family radical SAM protein n=1 Tax=Anaerovorax odorimutans TaxID=109327 RepID=A0ABT1RK18_9FIRM|nr:TIGR01212 family radical SAM protein [Anaerovorax odorimutans]MCQ4635306.1 TIGR01212 family radical SAM protein [Anaerovorax odorimutans]
MSEISTSYTFNAIGAHLKERMGCKIVKLSIDGGFTCPNRDGTKGTGGCIFCSAAGSGDLASDIPSQIHLLSDKWPNAKYLAYFQSHTNTYAPASELRRKYSQALEYPGVVGLAIATRPDCLSDEVLDLLSEFNRKTFLWVELGLQTIHEETASLINRCYPLSVYDHAVSQLSSRGIRVVTHLIFGLPGESKKQMLDSVRYVCRDLSGQTSPDHVPQRIFGIKLHMLNLVRGSQMEKLYPNYVSFQSIEEYIDLVISALEIIPPEITIHRLSGDAPRPTLIAPEWSYKKRTILNGIHKALRDRKTWQGRLAESDSQ